MLLSIYYFLVACSSYFCVGSCLFSFVVHGNLVGWPLRLVAGLAGLFRFSASLLLCCSLQSCGLLLSTPKRNIYIYIYIYIELMTQFSLPIPGSAATQFSMSIPASAATQFLFFFYIK
jgi:hypothetical protein